jgi:glycosyltransferase involved in cell wall biosynthesis
VVDDGSKDTTLSILQSFAAKGVKVISQSNQGAAAARNQAYRLSSGDYIKFLDADDVLSENCIEMQVKALVGKSDCVASAKWGRYFKNDLSDFQLSPEKVWRTLPGIDWVIQSLIEHGSNMTQPGIFLIPCPLIEKAGLWNEELSLIDDFDFMTRILVESNEVVFCDHAVLYYRGGMAKSLSMQKSRKDLESAYKAQMAGLAAILRKKNTNDAKLACANSLQLWAFAFYPKHLDLYKRFDQKIKELGGSTVKMDGGKLFILMRNILGWQMAKKIKSIFNPFRTINITDPKFLIPKASSPDN